jgi:hypothetical protein
MKLGKQIKVAPVLLINGATIFYIIYGLSYQIDIQ